MILPAAELVRAMHEFMWPFMRVSALLLSAPVFGTRLVPVRVRIVLALLLTWLIVPLLPATIAIPSLAPCDTISSRSRRRSGSPPVRTTMMPSPHAAASVSKSRTSAVVSSPRVACGPASR